MVLFASVFKHFRSTCFLFFSQDIRIHKDAKYQNEIANVQYIKVCIYIFSFMLFNEV